MTSPARNPEPIPGGRPRILLIEDEEDLAHSVKYHLEKEGGYSVSVASDGERGLALARERPFDLILLDLMLPGMDGLEICRALRAGSATQRVPIVMMTARVEESDRIVGLEMGADDYIGKPFSVREVLARVRAHLRREKRSAPELPVYRDDLLDLDFSGHVLRIAGEEVSLTRKEFELLAALVRAGGRVLSRDHLLEKVWGYQYFGGTRTVDVHVFRLRQKVGRDVEERIETVVGVGYRYKGRPRS
jgi:two-component system alkaline phosphatase synthesis response regulator PhoP